MQGEAAAILLSPPGQRRPANFRQAVARATVSGAR
jgi:hypothetical protein